MRSLHELITGPPPALPDTLDAVAERWASTSPRVRWAVGALVALVALTVAGRGAVRSPWGPPVEVVVATREVPAGATIGPDDLATAHRPLDLVAGAAHRVEDLIGTVARRPLAAGDVVRTDWAGDGGLAAEVAVGRAVVAVVDAVAPPVTPGWRVDVVAQGYDGQATVVAAAARVLAADGTNVWLDVARDEAPLVVAASARGDASLVLLPRG